MLHTLGKGSVQASSVQLYCSACRTCYHHNFYVSNERCIYYTDIPSVLQVSTHHFIEVQLIELWINSMLFAW
ncbi:hypothetical protein BDY19DRAFT_998057 [Irpex rosettiformis]|uniref:Uncharacterized protein n=1 Tax=Irpex rosettiformis TaxID=378272 RepID=A0ACB8TPS5_9APHY|nr:hypothetical protein BDY19DRAFT_998057 [Irpex rosettiformis]